MEPRLVFATVFALILLALLVVGFRALTGDWRARRRGRARARACRRQRAVESRTG